MIPSLPGLVLTALWAGLSSADQRALGGRQIHQPVVAAVIAGVILGSPERALLVGLWFQLVWIAPTPVGGRILPDTGATAVSAAVIAASVPGGLGLMAALVVGLLVAAVSIPWERALRKGNERREERALASQDPRLLRRAILSGITGPFLRGALCAGAAGAIALALRDWPAAPFRGPGETIIRTPILLLAAALIAAMTLLPRVRQESGRSVFAWVVCGLLLGLGGRLLWHQVGP